MQKTKVHVPSSDAKLAACGAPYNDFYRTPYCREDITCKACKRKPEYKLLPNAKG
jgi:hypothetical protein